MLFTMRCPHPPRTTGDQAARAHHGLFSKNLCPLSSSRALVRASAGLFRKGQRLLCFHTGDRSPTQLAAEKCQCSPWREEGPTSYRRSRLVHHVNHPKQAPQLLKPAGRKVLGPNVGQVDRRVDLLDRPDISVTKTLLQEQVT